MMMIMLLIVIVIIVVCIAIMITQPIILLIIIITLRMITPTMQANQSSNNTNKAYLVPNYLLMRSQLPPQQPLAILSASVRHGLRHSCPCLWLCPIEFVAECLPITNGYIMKFVEFVWAGAWARGMHLTARGRVSWWTPGRGARAPGSFWR